MKGTLEADPVPLSFPNQRPPSPCAERNCTPAPGLFSGLVAHQYQVQYELQRPGESRTDIIRSSKGLRQHGRAAKPAASS